MSICFSCSCRTWCVGQGHFIGRKGEDDWIFNSHGTQPQQSGEPEHPILELSVGGEDCEFLRCETLHRDERRERQCGDNTRRSDRIHRVFNLLNQVFSRHRLVHRPPKHPSHRRTTIEHLGETNLRVRCSRGAGRRRVATRKWEWNSLLTFLLLKQDLVQYV